MPLPQILVRSWLARPGSIRYFLHPRKIYNIFGKRCERDRKVLREMKEKRYDVLPTFKNSLQEVSQERQMRRKNPTNHSKNNNSKTTTLKRTFLRTLLYLAYHARPTTPIRKQYKKRGPPSVEPRATNTKSIAFKL